MEAEILQRLAAQERLLHALLAALQPPDTDGSVRIPKEAGHLFRDEAGQRSDLMPATFPR